MHFRVQCHDWSVSDKLEFHDYILKRNINDMETLATTEQFLSFKNVPILNNFPCLGGICLSAEVVCLCKNGGTIFKSTHSS